MTKLLTIRVTRCILVLSEKELMDLLARDPELFSKALKRGKGQLRYEQQVKRQRAD